MTILNVNPQALNASCISWLTPKYRLSDISTNYFFYFYTFNLFSSSLFLSFCLLCYNVKSHPSLHGNIKIVPTVISDNPYQTNLFSQISATFTSNLDGSCVKLHQINKLTIKSKTELSQLIIPFELHGYGSCIGLDNSNWQSNQEYHAISLSVLYQYQMYVRWGR